MVKDIISLARPQQWLKNVFIFLPIFFSRKLGDGACLSSALIAFVIYCLVAGSIYCLNDICDRESDRLHPTKCRRPIASGIGGSRIWYNGSVVGLGNRFDICL